MLVQQFLEQSATNSPGKTALICGASRYSYLEIDWAANAFSRGLLDDGFQRQDRAVIYLENSLEAVVAIFGVLKVGGIFAVIDAQVKARKLESILSNSEATTLITSHHLLAQVSDVVAGADSLQRIIITGEPQASTITVPGKNLISYDAIVAGATPEKPAPSCIDIDIASLVYTSGSTGIPKGVMLTHLNMVTAANSITQYLENTADDIILDTLPLAFDYGLYQVLMGFKCGATVVLEKGFVFPQQVVNLVIKEKVTGWPLVPTMAALLLRLKDLDKHDFSHLRYMTFTGQAIPPGHLLRLQELFPHVSIYSMYGLTECKRVAYLPPSELKKRPSSVGKAMPNTEVYIVDKNGIKVTEPHISGELVVRGANVMKGYWKLPKETARALRPGPYPGEQVLYSGDLFKTDEEGFLYFLGRKDDIIKTSGHMVSPREVENVLCDMEEIVEAAVIGVDDDILGKAVTAFVHMNSGATVTEKDIQAFCAARLESFAVPKHVVLLDALPKSSNGKINKQQLSA